MKVLVLSRYGRRGASSRLRTMQYATALAAAGIEVEFAPLFDDGYLARLYAGRPIGGSALRALARRLRRLLTPLRADVIWIEKEILPWMPWIAESALLPAGIPIVSDYDDAVFHRYDLHRLTPVRHLLGDKIDRLMAGSALVMAGNGYLAGRARRAGAPWVEVVPTVVDAAAYGPRPGARTAAEALRIGWIGTPSTGRAHLAPMMPLLTDIAGRQGARLSVVGAGPAVRPHPLVDVRPWSEAGEVGQIQHMDIGVMPLDDSPWAQGKCGYKLIQYMACGLPVVASPVGVNRTIVAHGINGFLAETEAEWRAALEYLLADPALRARLGAAGRAQVEDRYSLDIWGGRVVDLLRSVAQGRIRERSRPPA